MSVSESPWLTLLKGKAEEEYRFRLELFFKSLPLVEEKKSSGAPDDFITYLFGGAARVSQLAESDQDDDEDDDYDEWYTAPGDEFNISSVSVQFGRGRAGAARAPREFVDPDQDDNEALEDDDNEGARAAREFVDPDQDDGKALEDDDNDDATKYQVPLAVTRAKLADAERLRVRKQAPRPMLRRDAN